MGFEIIHDQKYLFAICGFYMIAQKLKEYLAIHI
jgi:hypothetical protein